MHLDVRTTVVDGPIALYTRRLDAANSGELGLQIMTMEQLAAHLAGGFLRPASSEDTDIAMRSALEAGGFVDLLELGEFPGAVRAVSKTLRRIWESRLPLAELAAGSHRIADLVLVDHRARSSLPCGSLALPDLVQAAMRRVHLAGRLTGAIEFAFLPHVAPVWRELVNALGRHVQVRWSGRLPPGSEGLTGEKVLGGNRRLPAPAVVACADPRSEVLESLRWVRQLLATGRARPRDIAVAAADPRTWDDLMLAARAETGLPLHFSHGIPALGTRVGQACAALADLLQHGLSQGRIRRVLAHCAAGAPGLAQLPANALIGIPRDAALTELAHWRSALGTALPVRPDGSDPAPALMPLLDSAARGLGAAEEAGRLFLPSAAQKLWTEALLRAPGHALPITLEALRSADTRDPGDSVTWGPAGHLAAAPRRFVCLLGLNSGAWPRQSSEDPILPSHILDPLRFGIPTVADQDRAAFSVICGEATGALTLSRARRSARGSILPPSPLLPSGVPERILERHRIPPHASGPSDRLLARPDEAAVDVSLSAAKDCSSDRRSRHANAHDGLLSADHALVAEALERVLSATSLRLLLRDPQGFIWKHVLHWSSAPRASRELKLDPRSHGELVHEILRGAVEALELGAGYGRATQAQVHEAVDSAAGTALATWPPRRPTPPGLLWAYTVESAAEQANRALERDLPLQPSTRSYTEISFGGKVADGPDGLKRPWQPGQPVSIPGSELSFGGSIDRLDIRGDGAVQVTDYKTGETPRRYGSMVLDGGRELQRVLYALAARTLLSDVRAVRARLAFLRERPALLSVLPDVDHAIDLTARCLADAVTSLRRGTSLPGPDADDEWADRRLGLPSPGSGYSVIKHRAFQAAFGEVARIWSAR